MDMIQDFEKGEGAVTSPVADGASDGAVLEDVVEIQRWISQGVCEHVFKNVVPGLSSVNEFMISYVPGHVWFQDRESEVTPKGHCRANIHSSFLCGCNFEKYCAAKDVRRHNLHDFIQIGS